MISSAAYAWRLSDSFISWISLLAIPCSSYPKLRYTLLLENVELSDSGMLVSSALHFRAQDLVRLKAI